MLFMELILRGIGIFTMMVFMLMYFLLIAIRYGGIGGGIGVFPARIGGSDGVGLRHGITQVGILLIGMEAIGEVIGVDITAGHGIITAGQRQVGIVRGVQTIVLRVIGIIQVH